MLAQPSLPPLPFKIPKSPKSLLPLAPKKERDTSFSWTTFEQIHHTKANNRTVSNIELCFSYIKSLNNKSLHLISIIS